MELKEKTPTTPIIYKDLDMSFVRNPNTGDVFFLRNKEAIKKSIKHLVLTNFYDIPFEPNLGSNVRNFLFENDTTFNRILLKNYITEVIENYEPRVQLIDVNVRLIDNNFFDIEIVYNFENIPEQKISFNLILKRLR